MTSIDIREKKIIFDAPRAVVSRARVLRSSKSDLAHIGGEANPTTHGVSIAGPRKPPAARPVRDTDSPLEGDGFEQPGPREIAEACRRHEQTVGRRTRHLAPWRSSESDGPSVGANEWARSMATYGANGFSNH